MSKAVIIVAGGTGSRMQSATPKQFLSLAGTPILVYTIKRFIRFDPGMRIVIVLPGSHLVRWENIETEFFPAGRLITAVGGDNRYLSVRNGLDCLDDEEFVAIHDGVRPLVSMQTIRACFSEAARFDGAIPVLPVQETLRRRRNEGSETVNREDYLLVQTPQVFRTNLIKKAYEQAYTNGFTDDASVFESAGFSVQMVEGNRENIKITTPTDLILAEALLKHIF